MGSTDFPLNHALAVQRWSTFLAVEAEKKQYFNKFMGTGEDALIKVQKELSKQAGEKITVGLRMKLSGDGTEGDDIIEGTVVEEGINFFHDALFIDQRRKGTKSKGKMSEQRVPYNLRKIGHEALSTWFAEDFDEQLMMYLAGDRGVDASFHVPTTFDGRANNLLIMPDVNHSIFGGDATSHTDLDVTDKMHLSITERLVALAETRDPMMLPFMIEGEKKYVLLMHTWQAYDMRTSTSQNDWLEIQKAAGPRERQNIVYRNALGEYAGVIMHKHRNVIRFDDWGAGTDVKGARALFLGAQAGMIAFGAGGSANRYSWNEETDDRGNALVITAGCIYGTKRSIYNDESFGVVAVDTACKDPNSP